MSSGSVREGGDSTMKMLADMLKDDKPKPSHGMYYKGAAALASEKHFTA